MGSTQSQAIMGPPKRNSTKKPEVTSSGSVLATSGRRWPVLIGEAGRCVAGKGPAFHAQEDGLANCERRMSEKQHACPALEVGLGWAASWLIESELETQFESPGQSPRDWRSGFAVRPHWPASARTCRNSPAAWWRRRSSAALTERTAVNEEPLDEGLSAANASNRWGARWAHPGQILFTGSLSLPPVANLGPQWRKNEMRLGCKAS
jgi:hypothetical protein